MTDEAEDYGVGSFSKLFASIVTSTLWREPDHIRVVWITMLAICNKHGVVLASVPGLAAVANVTLEYCLDAIERLMSPDPWSRTKEHDGRRIEVVRGGWRLLNYAHYRDARGQWSDEPSMTPEAIRKRRQRERDSERDTVTSSDGGRPASASASASPVESVNGKEQKDSLHSQSESLADRVTAFVAKHAFGRWRDGVEGYLRASRKPAAVMAELELWMAGELNRRKTDPETLAEALNAYDAATEHGEFKTNHFGGFVRGVHRARERNDNSRRNTSEARSIAEETRAAEERRREEADQAMLVAFANAHPVRCAELKMAAEAEIDRQMPRARDKTPQLFATLVRDELVRLVRVEGQ